MAAFDRRIKAEEDAKKGLCSCIGCTNQATHTWSGHPTCDECGTPGRNKTQGLRILNIITREK